MFSRASARLSRRAFLSGIGAAALAGPSVLHAENFCNDLAAAAPTSRAATPLGAASGSVQWGVAIGSPGLDEPFYVALVESERPKYLAIANALKFDHLYARQPAASASLASVANFDECDTILALARRLDVPVRGDCLAWNDWPPGWLKKLVDDGNTEQARKYFRQHFENVFAHFAALPASPPLAAVGVVNEPFDPWNRRFGIQGWRPGPWSTAFGSEPDGTPSYIHEAFALAERFAKPGTKLFLNEAHCENDRFGPLMRAAMLRLIDGLQRAGRRVDAIGLECHLMPHWMADPQKPDWQPFVRFLDEIGRRGIAVYLTELDVIDCSVRDTQARDRLVADTMRTFLTAALQSSAVVSISNWDLSDRFSWLRESNVHRGLAKWALCPADPPCPRPTPYDANYSPKSARDALAAGLSTRR